MTDHRQPDDDRPTNDPEADDLSAVLADPTLWEPVEPADEQAILAAISASLDELEDHDVGPDRAVADPTTSDDPTDDAAIAPVIELSSARRWLGPVLAGVAAAVVVLVGASVFTGSGSPVGTQVELAATDLAPGAVGVVTVAETPNGTRIVLDVDGLEPAPDGTYYEAWVRQDAAIGVSAGTFHLRGGGGEIELWAGVPASDYPLFTITIQDEASPVSSGEVVLRARLDE